VRSIRRDLLAGLLSALLLVGLAASAATYFAAHRQANEMFDYQLQQMALSLRDQAPEDAQAELFPDFARDFVVQMRGPGGVLVYLSSQDVLLPRSGNGFDTVSVNGEDWRVYTLSRGGKVIQVAAPSSLRRDRAVASALRILVPIVAAIPLFALLIWWLVGRELRPLGVIERALGTRAPSSLEPLPETGLPEEVRPMVTQLNALLERLGGAIETQKRFTADAAHELRSPLTALQLQIQLLERAVSPEARREALEQLKAGARRASRLVEQLLTMARLAPEATQEEPTAVELDRLAASVAADFEPLAAAKAVELRLGRVEPACTAGRERALRTLAGNLVDNAIRYTPAGGRVTLDAYAQPGCAVLAIEDTGPGIPAEERARVLDRFYRLPGSGAEGSGLGLAIVKQIADAHGAAIELGEGEQGRGLRVAVRFAAGNRRQLPAIK
jgi:two-component system, OmpR family, sensor kinase